jgi:putative DNA primase/helicase
MSNSINLERPVTHHPEDSGCELITRHGGCTLTAYSIAKKLPEPFLVDLGLSDTLQSGKPVLQMPYRAADGALQAIRYRTSLEKGKESRFRWRLGDAPCLYGLPYLRSEAEVALVEGESDTHTLLYHGINVVGVPGGSSWKDERDAPHLARYDTIYVVIEPDNGGKSLLKALSESRLRDRIRIVQLDGVKDVSEMHVERPEHFRDRWSAALEASVPINILESDKEAHELSFGPFEMTEAGLFADVQKGKAAERRWLAAPFRVVGRCRDPHSRQWGRLLSFEDDDSVVHQVVVTDADLHGDRGVLFGKLADQGLKVTTNSRDRGLLVSFLNEVKTSDRVTLMRRTGWHVLQGRRVFVHPANTLGRPVGEIVRLISGNKTPYEQSGTLEEWKAVVGLLVGHHSRLVLLCSAAFAGPLLILVGHEGGGLHVHGPSSSGKTAGLQAAASIWGKGGNPGFVLPWRQTANAFEAILAGRTDTLVAYDEIGVGDAKAIGTAIYQITAGTGKARLDRESRLQEPATWRSILLSTGEVPAGTKITEDGGKRPYAGQQVRILDIPVDLGDGVGIFDADGLDGTAGDLADRIKDASQRWYGVAGPAFLGRLLEEGPDDVGGLINEMIDAFVQANVPAGADGQVRRAARFLGLVGAAGELATTWDILPWQDGAALEASAKAFKDWIGQRGGHGAAEERDGIEQVRAFLAAYGESRFDPIGDPDVRPANARAGWRRGSGEAREWLILPSAWRDEICRGRDSNFIAGALEHRGMLRRDSEGKYQRSERTPLGQRRVYVVNASILEAGDES